MKYLAYITAIIALCFATYGAGYRHGGEDFAYLEHMMLGMLSNSEIARCDEYEDPHGCYKWSEELSIGHAFVFYTQHSEKLSPISRYIFPDSYEGHLKAVANLYSLATERDHEDLCDYAGEVSEVEFRECKQEIAQFIEMAGSHINKAKQAGKH